MSSELVLVIEHTREWMNDRTLISVISTVDLIFVGERRENANAKWHNFV
jgi:hypothetical protein